MNSQFDIKYLDGCDDSFEPSQGASIVHTMVKKGFKPHRPNAAKPLENMAIIIAEINNIFLDIEENLVEPYAATLNRIWKNP